ncbi:glycosyltransferase [Adhaeribacter rhizoryzae]|uniref:Glycosyltransferase n=1 Tax=Adhaeribacter rhizoryzae TaxID=2607907 RepID=A0A5M6DNN3_9BACT|nr:nucleotide disphospho-sugar-binding domain-containing protein [Adhaeribacter rhizoryzae]KAA5549151.1 glycosyltransferase [Adhaeribacter rhizoryzae]
MKTKKILFANIPADGHFNPLTGLAIHIKSIGYDVRWYTGRKYEEKIISLGIPYYPLVNAMDFSVGNPEELFPERDKCKSQVSKLQFDIKNVFLLRGPEFYQDIKKINEEFNFDLLIADITFTGIPWVREKLNKKVISVGIMPLSETSKDLAPNGLAITPNPSFLGRCKQNVMRFVADKILFAESSKLIKEIFGQYGIKQEKGNLFDVLYRKSDLVLQSGTPGFEYKRSDLSRNIRFIGPLLPVLKNSKVTFKHHAKALAYNKVILVTQGTVETDHEKIIVPTLEAFKDSDRLVIVTTGGSGTAELRARYPQRNIIIEDFIPFTEVMPLADVYVTNGGYGGLMLGIQHKLPLVVAGVHEGKNEICARVGYFKLGINLKTEKPTPQQMRLSVEQVLTNPIYKKNVEQLSEEFNLYNPPVLCAKYVADLIGKPAQDETTSLNIPVKTKMAVAE